MKPYIPDKLPLQGLDYGRLFSLVGSANAELARYGGLLQGIVNPDVMLSPLTTQEAVLSSKIEGTQATFDEVLEQEAGLVRQGGKTGDVYEIVNYRKAMIYARSHLKQNAISLAFVCRLHEILMDGVRGENKMPGEFRDVQNWIGTPGRPMEKATFIPPAPSCIAEDMADWQRYIEMDDIDALLQAAVVHAQFELIHPFCDGNGRIGRILMPLFLYQKNKLSEPMFYISAYLEANRSEYYKRLRLISEKKDWNGWIEFFFRALIEQAKDNNKKLTDILAFYDEMKVMVGDVTHSRHTITIIDAIFDKPVFTAPDFVRRSGIKKNTAAGLLRSLKGNDILRELQPSSGSNPAVWCLHKLLDITENGRLA